jgi:hypothetical protein
MLGDTQYSKTVDLRSGGWIRIELKDMTDVMAFTKSKEYALLLKIEQLLQAYEEAARADPSGAS